MDTPELMLLGGPNSGKTHYAGQLYGRLRRRSGLLRLRTDKGTPTDLSALEEVLACLQNGNAAGHTSTETFTEVVLPLTDGGGHSMDLHWPDYGGEQLSTVFDQRKISENWRKRLVGAQGWVLLIRLNGETTYPDALERLGEQSSQGVGNPERSSWDANAYWIELLQLLLHATGLGPVTPVQQPRLAVLLSCYDELGKGEEAPREVLTEKLPLLASFLRSSWASDALSIWGLSSLGRLLESNTADDAFIAQGPEDHGWVVKPDGGSRDPDLTRPLAWLLAG